MEVSEEQYHQIALEAQDEKWELHDGRLREKPGMTYQHNHIEWFLGVSLQSQLDPREFEVRVDAGRARRSARNYFIPDVMVIPRVYTLPLRDRHDLLEHYADPLPLVVEVWSRSTGAYDVKTKLPEYQRRGDAEIWLIHPLEHTLTAWQRQPEGGYRERLYRGGHVQPFALPDVTIDLDALFAV